MKLIYGLLIGFFLVGCEDNKAHYYFHIPAPKPKTSEAEKDTNTVSLEPVVYSYGVAKNLTRFIPYSDFPSSIHLDSIVELNHEGHASAYILYPVGPNKNINAYIKRFGKKIFSEFMSGLTSASPSNDAVMSDVQMVPTAIYVNDKLTSYKFYHSDYYEGCAHPNSEYYSFTFHNKTGRLLTFSDVFHLKSKQDTLQLIALINEQIYVPDVTPLSTLEDIDFNVTEEGISFNFGPYDIGYYAEGSREGLVPYKKLRSYLNPRLF